MVFTGMIFQFDSAQGTGLIMLSDGEKKEFSTDEWVDESNMPAVGLKISYESSDHTIKIKAASEEDKNVASPDEETNKEEITSFSSEQEFQDYFSDKGFDVIKNIDEITGERLSMGKFSDEGVQIVSISLIDPKLEFSEKTVSLSSMDDHIQYFQDTGYRLINDSDDHGSRKATLRRYVMDEHAEIIIRFSDDKVTVTKMINGKKVY